MVKEYNEKQKKIRNLYRDTNLKPPEGEKKIHTLQFHRMVTNIAKSGGVENPYKAAMSKLGRSGAVLKPHRSLNYKKKKR